jgi:hypothetical protein
MKPKPNIHRFVWALSREFASGTDGGFSAFNASQGCRASLMAVKKKRWSRRVTQTSDALTLEDRVFTRSDPRSIARSLKRSAERSQRRKAEPYQSAMSMLTFYVNRAGKNMPVKRKRTLESAKEELRNLNGKNAEVRKEAGDANGKKASCEEEIVSC